MRISCVIITSHEEETWHSASQTKSNSDLIPVASEIQWFFSKGLFSLRGGGGPQLGEVTSLVGVSYVSV